MEVKELKYVHPPAEMIKTAQDYNNTCKNDPEDLINNIPAVKQ